MDILHVLVDAHIEVVEMVDCGECFRLRNWEPEHRTWQASKNSLMHSVRSCSSTSSSLPYRANPLRSASNSDGTSGYCGPSTDGWRSEKAKKLTRRQRDASGCRRKIAIRSWRDGETY